MCGQCMHVAFVVQWSTVHVMRWTAVFWCHGPGRLAVLKGWPPYTVTLYVDTFHCFHFAYVIWVDIPSLLLADAPQLHPHYCCVGGVWHQVRADGPRSSHHLAEGDGTSRRSGSLHAQLQCVQHDPTPCHHGNYFTAHVIGVNPLGCMYFEVYIVLWSVHDSAVQWLNFCFYLPRVLLTSLLAPVWSVCRSLHGSPWLSHCMSHFPWHSCLATGEEPPRVPIFVRRSTLRLPFRPICPIIMVGPGTGREVHAFPLGEPVLFSHWQHSCMCVRLTCVMRLLLSFSNTASCMGCSHGSWMVMLRARMGNCIPLHLFSMYFPIHFAQVMLCVPWQPVSMPTMYSWQMWMHGGVVCSALVTLSGVRGYVCSFLLSMQVWHHSGASFRSAVLESARTKPSVALCYTLAVVTKVKITFTRTSWRLTVRMGPSLICW